MKIVKNANLIGFFKQLVFPLILTDSQPLDTYNSFLRGPESAFDHHIRRSSGCYSLSSIMF